MQFPVKPGALRRNSVKACTDAGAAGDAAGGAAGGDDDGCRLSVVGGVFSDN